MSRDRNKVDFGRLKTRGWRWVIESEQEETGDTGFSGSVPAWMVMVFPRTGIGSTRRDADLGIGERGK